jgi:hypothetical protein
MSAEKTCAILVLSGVLFATGAYAEEKAGAERDAAQDSAELSDDAKSDTRDSAETDSVLRTIEADYATLGVTVACETYEIDSAGFSHVSFTSDTPYDDYNYEWGHHALDWKGQRFTAWTGGSYDRWAITSSDPTPPAGRNTRGLTCGDEDTLNDLEDSGVGLYTVNGQAQDPAGGWYCASQTWPRAAAAQAAMVMYLWGSPTYVNLYGNHDYVSSGSDAVYFGALERVTLCSANPLFFWKKPHELCQWDSATVGGLASGASQCANYLILHSVEASYWGREPTGYETYREGVSWDAAEWDDLYGPSGFGATDWQPDMIYDPPDEVSLEELDAVEDAAAKIGEAMWTVEDGVPVGLPDDVAGRE